MGVVAPCGGFHDGCSCSSLRGEDAGKVKKPGEHGLHPQKPVWANGDIIGQLLYWSRVRLGEAEPILDPERARQANPLGLP